MNVVFTIFNEVTFNINGVDMKKKEKRGRVVLKRRERERERERAFCG